MILLVEDSDDDVFLFERAMKRAKFSMPFYNAKDGQEAIDYLQAIGKFVDRSAYPMPSVILLDIKIPYLHGFDVLEWIKQQPPLNNVPVMMLTSSLEGKDRERAAKLGAEGFYIKPPTTDMLTEIFGKAGMDIASAA